MVKAEAFVLAMVRDVGLRFACLKGLELGLTIPYQWGPTSATVSELRGLL